MRASGAVSSTSSTRSPPVDDTDAPVLRPRSLLPLGVSGVDPPLFPETRDGRGGRALSAGFDDLVAAEWVHRYDAAWLGKDWARVRASLSEDVEFLSGDFASPLKGRRAVLESIRAFLERVHVHEYNATDLTSHRSGPVAVVNYRWQMEWTLGAAHRSSSGRDVLVLRNTSGEWLLVWRAQLAG
jgi:ketosteroid isomerase-like protein